MKKYILIFYVLGLSFILKGQIEPKLGRKIFQYFSENGYCIFPCNTSKLRISPDSLFFIDYTNNLDFTHPLTFFFPPPNLDIEYSDSIRFLEIDLVLTINNFLPMNKNVDSYRFSAVFENTKILVTEFKPEGEKYKLMQSLLSEEPDSLSRHELTCSKKSMDRIVKKVLNLLEQNYLLASVEKDGYVGVDEVVVESVVNGVYQKNCYFIKTLVKTKETVYKELIRKFK